MTRRNGKFRETATVKNGRVRIGQRVKVTCQGCEFVIEAIYQEFDRRTGSLTFLCGPNGTAPVPAYHCEKVRGGDKR